MLAPGFGVRVYPWFADVRDALADEYERLSVNLKYRS
jgi:hypothetical protein